MDVKGTDVHRFIQGTRAATNRDILWGVLEQIPHGYQGTSKVLGESKFLRGFLMAREVGTMYRRVVQGSTIH